MKRVYKGDFGYIRHGRKVAIIRTAICLAITVGIFLTKQFMDTVDYKYENNKNILTIQKRIE